MALRLARAFDTSAESWLNQHMHYDLWLAQRGAKALRVRKLAVQEHKRRHYGVGGEIWLPKP